MSSELACSPVSDDEEAECSKVGSMVAQIIYCVGRTWMASLVDQCAVYDEQLIAVRRQRTWVRRYSRLTPVGLFANGPRSRVATGPYVILSASAHGYPR